MQLSTFFIRRPIFAVVLSVLLVLAGLAALRVLPVARYPEIAPPMVSVSAYYPGASAEAVERTVATVIEEQLTGVEHMLYMNSVASSDGRLTVNVTFALGTNLDLAMVNVNNRVRQAETRLPQEVRRQGITVAKFSPSFLVVVALFAPDDRYDALYLSNYATQHVIDRLKRLPGVGKVDIYGAKDYAMRIWMRPDRMAQLGVTVSDVAAAVGARNAQYAAGRIGAPPGNSEQLTLTVTTHGRLQQPDDFGNIIVRAGADGGVIRVRDVARVQLGAKDYNFHGRLNGHPTAPIGVFLENGANALETRAAVEQTMRELAATFPAGLRYATPYDTAPFVEASIREVVVTLTEAMVLVFLVVYLFLQDWRATLIPTLAVPVSLIGTLAGLKLLGYSLNTLTLFGMVLAIGIVVDDAIVVLENVERLMREERLGPADAAARAMAEVSGPVVAIVLVLCAAFVPVAFLGGLAGELYRQFSVTISLAVVLSGFVALTLTPVLCARLLRPHTGTRPALFRWFNRGFDGAQRRYTRGVRFFLQRGTLGLCLFGAMLAATAWLGKVVPGSLVPAEDQGYFIGAAVLPEGAALDRTDAMARRIEETLRGEPEVDAVFSLVGLNLLGGGGIKSSVATLFFPLRPWEERSRTALELVRASGAKTGDIRAGLPLFFNPPTIQGIGQTGGFEFYLQNTAEGGVRKLAELLPAFLDEANRQPELAGVKTLWQPYAPQLYVEVDDEKAHAMGVRPADIYDTLAATLGSYYVNDFNKDGRVYTVQLQAEGRYRARPEDIGALYVRSSGGALVQLAALVQVRHVSGPDSVEHFNGLAAVKLLGEAKPGYSSAQAMAAVERVAKKVLPEGVGYDWGGASYQERHNSGTAGFAIGGGMLVIFLILAALYGHWSLPMSVLLAVPFGVFGALLAVYLRGFPNDVYFQIGLVTLLGLAAKNAILIVEFALLRLIEGATPFEAALQAASLRFRPILMTSLAFILGVLPLAFARGAGAAARQSMGTGVLGGMLAATFLSIYLVPLFFMLVAPRRKTAAVAMPAVRVSEHA